MACLRNPDRPGQLLDYNETERVAHSMGLRLQSVQALRTEEFDHAFAAITKDRAQALIVPAVNPLAFTNWRRIASFAQTNRLPSIRRPQDSIAFSLDSMQ